MLPSMLLMHRKLMRAQARKLLSLLIDTTCYLLDVEYNSESYNLVKTAQLCKHMRTCHKKKDITCRFCTPWLVTEKTRIVHGNSDFYNIILKKSKGRIDKVLMNY